MPTPEQDQWLATVLSVQFADRAPQSAQPNGSDSEAAPADGGGADDQAEGFFSDLKDRIKNFVSPGKAPTPAAAVSTPTPAPAPTATPPSPAPPPTASPSSTAPKPPLTPAAPVPRADLGAAQQDRADKALLGLSADDQVKVKKLLSEAKGDEKKYITKALSSKHSAAELEAFAKKIAGKDEKWLNDNLHLVGETGGVGIKQQWHDSCAPTTLQAMHGEIDPIYALKLHEESSKLTSADDDDATKLNPKLAAEQKALLEGAGGVAKPRAPGKSAGGQGVSLGGLFNSQTPTTGVKFEVEPITGDAEMDKALNDAETALKGGLPVPVRVGSGSDGHAVLMTGVDPGPPRRYSFHDPWDGKTLVFTDAQIKSNNIDIAGWTKMTHLYKPSLAD
jgi:hypothetical protein